MNAVSSCAAEYVKLFKTLTCGIHIVYKIGCNVAKWGCSFVTTKVRCSKQAGFVDTQDLSVSWPHQKMFQHKKRLRKACIIANLAAFLLKLDMSLTTHGLSLSCR